MLSRQGDSTSCARRVSFIGVNGLLVTCCDASLRPCSDIQSCRSYFVASYLLSINPSFLALLLQLMQLLSILSHGATTQRAVRAWFRLNRVRAVFYDDHSAQPVIRWFRYSSLYTSVPASDHSNWVRHRTRSRLLRLSLAGCGAFATDWLCYPPDCVRRDLALKHDF